MPSFADRIRETTTTTGTGDITLSGTAATRHARFQDQHQLGDRIRYCIEGQSGSEYEVGVGVLTGTTTLTRERVFESSNTDALVDFSAGTKDVYEVADARTAGAATFGMQAAMRMGYYL
jgi:hypothetical protein